MTSFAGLVVDVDSSRLTAELLRLATFGEPPLTPPKAGEVAVTRIVFSTEDRAARRYVKDLATEAGLSIREDAVGNTFFRWRGTEDALPAVATGSHIDAIPHAGMYDGTIGVLGGLEAMRALRAAGFTPRRSIELILFTSEEPTRFGIGCLGSRMMSGTLSLEAASKLVDKDGKTLATVLFSGALSEVKIVTKAYSGFVELHIEQGKLLEEVGIPIGIVTGIAATAGLKIMIEGEGGHAGALLMRDRRDALVAAAELIQAVEMAALATGAIDTVATVGMCEVFPGAVNSVPSRVQLALDVRDTDLARRDGVLTAIQKACERIAAARNITISQVSVNADAPASSADSVLHAIAEACEAEKLRSMRMVSRAYHDALFMAKLAPTAMIFIPCRNGVSHRPDEYASAEHIADGVRVLARTLAELSHQ